MLSGFVIIVTAKLKRAQACFYVNFIEFNCVYTVNCTSSPDSCILRSEPRI